MLGEDHLRVGGVDVRRGAEADQEVVEEGRAERAVGTLFDNRVHAEVPSVIVNQERRADASLHHQPCRLLLRGPLRPRSTERIDSAVRAALSEPFERHVATHALIHCSLRDEPSLPAQ